MQVSNELNVLLDDLVKWATWHGKHFNPERLAQARSALEAALAAAAPVETLDSVLAEIEAKGWRLNMYHHPPVFRCCAFLPGTGESLLADGANAATAIRSLRDAITASRAETGVGE